MRSLATYDARDSDPTIVTAARILTVDDARPEAEAMLTDRGVILALGSLAEVEQAAREAGLDAVRADYPGETIVPGFIDAHAHPLMYGQMLTWIDVSPAKAGSIPEIVELMREGAKKLPAGVPLRGYGYEQRNLEERRHPTRFELDEIATDREVYLMNASGHGGVVNSFTFEKFGVTRDTPNPEGGEFFRDADGELTGELSDAACNVLTGLHGVKIGHHGPNFHLGDEPAEHQRQLDLVQREFLAGGVTAIGDAQVSKREFAAYLELADRGALNMRVSMYFLSHLLDQVVDLGFTGPFGNAFLSAAGIKLYADGTLGGWTAYFPEGYVGDPCRTGQLYHEPREYTELVRKAHSAGLQTATHAQSPTAIKMVVDAIEQALADRPDADARHRIEHCGLPAVEEVARMAELGIRPVNQTQHYYNWGEGVEQAIGTPGERFNPLGEFEAAGVPMTISSDAPVAEPRPLEAIQAAVTRVTRRGHQLGPDSLRISPEAALRAHTLEGAISIGREREIGSLAVGKRADFVVLGGDPLATEGAEISQIPVRETWVDGTRRFSAEA
ncbi:hydrolase [Leucobacter sp. OLJS4]|uniref:amidohydrolase n=1 Tax=unclassified Leucobacter TaxID=2621730 RepID=UPI000C1881DE|nr:MULTISPECIES: amidohydrolase [unclassified Leucobacter]PII83816.1 hydrolase [Leucobacter sp. OLCALW19]PII89349.1 hydrolase [Leucobacter sp. OLTLW20]PII90654.1 hydrolase [Leucobacter sp. OLAS13]PII98357.1 hydrolase [Leucobacter sp. OLCS4]PII99631.1 hydrolase [Leucobacter sp. OLDS2]